MRSPWTAVSGRLSGSLVRQHYRSLPACAGALGPFKSLRLTAELCGPLCGGRSALLNSHLLGGGHSHLLYNRLQRHPCQLELLTSLLLELDRRKADGDCRMIQFGGTFLVGTASAAYCSHGVVWSPLPKLLYAFMSKSRTSPGGCFEILGNG